MEAIQQLQKTKRILENPAYKDKVRILKTSAETGGVYSLAELEVAPGGGNSLHIHKAFTETFIVVKGTLGVMYGNRKIYLRPGGTVTVPPEMPHYFFNETSETVVCRIKFQPGHEGFEKGIAIAYGLATDGKTTKKGIPKNIAHLALIISLTDTKPTGILGLLSPVFLWIAQKAKKKGIEKALLKKYYYQ